jgi:SAM-dependent methyltransferase
MEGSYPGQLRIWERSAVRALRQPGWSVKDEPGFSPETPIPNEVWSSQKARWLFARETLNPSVHGPKPIEGCEPFSLQWYLAIEHQRHERRGRWIPRLLEFAKHSGETLLGIGNGLGTDWVQYARHGAAVMVCSSSTDDLGLIQRNFELRGLSGRFLHASPLCLPLENASIDVVCIEDVLAEAGDARSIVQEVYRVLKPGGKVLALAPACYDVDYWSRAFFPWQRWLGWTRRNERVYPSLGLERLSSFSARRLRRLFDGFIEHRIHKRQLRRSEVPHIWRFLPLSLLQRIMGRTLILKAFKPLSAINARQIAA